jgi:hypothetical protein
MTLVKYEEFIQEEILEKIYMSPKYIKIDDKMKIFYKRLETFLKWTKISIEIIISKKLMIMGIQKMRLRNI